MRSQAAQLLAVTVSLFAPLLTRLQTVGLSLTLQQWLLI
jgi:hypothetical protein